MLIGRPGPQQKRIEWLYCWLLKYSKVELLFIILVDIETEAIVSAFNYLLCI